MPHSSGVRAGRGDAFVLFQASECDSTTNLKMPEVLAYTKVSSPQLRTHSNHRTASRLHMWVPPPRSELDHIKWLLRGVPEAKRSEDADYDM